MTRLRKQVAEAKSKKDSRIKEEKRQVIEELRMYEGESTSYNDSLNVIPSKNDSHMNKRTLRTRRRSSI